MANLVDTLKKLFGGSAARPGAGDGRQPRDPQFVGRSSRKEIEQAPPERVGELVGHAPERVET
jgi:hypothetical protein